MILVTRRDSSLGGRARSRCVAGVLTLGQFDIGLAQFGDHLLRTVTLLRHLPTPFLTRLRLEILPHDPDQSMGGRSLHTPEFVIPQGAKRDIPRDGLQGAIGKQPSKFH